MSYDWEAKLFGAFFVLIGLALLCCIVGAGFAVRVDAVCKEKGWARSEVTWNLNGYCITRVDQTDVVRPWREAEQR